MCGVRLVATQNFTFLLGTVVEEDTNVDDIQQLYKVKKKLIF